MTFENINQISEKLILALKMDQPSEGLLSVLKNLSPTKLYLDLNSDNPKKAFWINIYNSFFQILRKVHQLDKSVIYTEKIINIAGQKFSLDDVEHGILRKYRYKFSLGYLPNLFTSTIVKKLAVSKIDYRIHFALNCGAKSCPPIAFYRKDNIDSQLDMATRSFLESETDVLNIKKEIHISKLFQWFKGDFGGNQGIRQILHKNLNLDTQGYTLIYKPYSLDEVLDNYSEISFDKETSGN